MRYFSLFLYFIAVFIASCNNEVIKPVNEVLIFEKQGLVDSAVVTQCVSDTKRFFSDTLDLSSLAQIRIEFEGNTNSNGSFIKVYWNDVSSANNLVYSAVDLTGIPKLHKHVFKKPSEKVWFEIRIYINPPVCGTGEFKFTSVRNLKIIAIN